MGSERLTKFRIGQYRYPVKIIEKGARLEFEFPYNKELIEEIKVFDGAKWHGFDEVQPRKVWTVANSEHNKFQIEFLEEKNPYAKYDAPLVEFTSKRKLYSHQLEMVRHGLTTHYCLWAADTGTGKTLAAIELMEAVTDPESPYYIPNFNNWLWCGPKSALNAIKLEMEKWQCKVIPSLLTYDALWRIVEKHGVPPIVQGVIFDESSRLKTHTTQRSQAAQQLADLIRTLYGDNGFVILMSGTPAPKSPFDWWSQCRIPKPGFIREGRFDKFKSRLCLIKTEETITGSYPKIVTWWDDENKCSICGQYEADNIEHTEEAIASGLNYHIFQKSKNEVLHLYERMKGLVRVWLKKDCLDLPEKHFRIIKVNPTREIVNAARLIAARGESAIETLTLLRELSDGFQYQDKVVGTETCTGCHGTKYRKEKVQAGHEPGEPTLEENPINKSDVVEGDYFELEVLCSRCKGKGTLDIIQRQTVQVECPKEEVLMDLLDDHEEDGRLIIYAGFTGSIERCISIVKKKGWNFIKADGKGWNSDLDTQDPKEMLKKFADKNNDLKIAFVGQPGAAGMGLNLQASHEIVYYSNDFNGESRTQSMNRTHRLGMDVDRGCMITDIVNLPTDKLVLDNLDKKRKLESLTLGEIQVAITTEIVQR